MLVAGINPVFSWRPVGMPLHSQVLVARLEGLRSLEERKSGEAGEVEQFAVLQVEVAVTERLEEL